MFPRTPAEYQRHIAERLNWFEQLADKATSLDERINVTNLLLMEILKVSAEEKEAFPFPPALSRALIDHLTKDRPEFYKFIDIDLSTARTNELHEESGSFIWIENQFARGEVTLRLNEDYFDTFDLRRQRYIRGPFYRFFITNLAGQGSIRLFISRGFQAASEPIEAINRAELAARLGSIDTFDRRGDVIWMDDFESGVQKWRATVWGGSFAWSADHARSGGFSAKLTTDTGLGDKIELRHFLPIQNLSRIGIELHITTGVNLKQYEIGLKVFTAAISYNPWVRFTAATSTWEYYDGSAWQPLAPITKLTTDEFIFVPIKMVVDYPNAKYVRLMVNDVKFDLSGYSCEVGLGGYPWCEALITISNTGDGGNPCTCYLDNVIITQNEP
ncbi:hypothetical protein ES703_04116 [subsurface metagenome]